MWVEIEKSQFLTFSKDRVGKSVHADRKRARDRRRREPGRTRCSHPAAPKVASLTFSAQGPSAGWSQGTRAAAGVLGCSQSGGGVWGQLGRVGLGPTECFPSWVSVRRSLGVGWGD